MQALAINFPLDLSRFIAQAFVAGLWQGLILISAVAAFLRFVPRLSAGVRFTIWGFAYAQLLIIPLVQLRTPPIQQLHGASSVVHLGARWGFVVAGVWASLMVLRAAQLLVQAIRLRRTWKRATPISDEAALQAIPQEGSRDVEICTSADVDAPSVIGFFSPRLLIPEWLLERLTPLELRQIVLHECEHLRRHDDWINLAQKAGLALFPLNPALLWMDRRLSLERELACDAGVVASTATPFDYAYCLTRLAEHRLHRRSVALSLAAWSRQSELARRVHSLLRPAHKMSPLRARLSVALICIGLGIGAVQMARVPRFLSFTDVATVSIADATSPASNSMSARAIPVAYRAAAQSHATLLKAVMPSRRAQRLPHMPSPGMKLQKVRAARAPQRPRVVLTTFEIPEGRPRLRADALHDSSGNVTSPRSSPSYAAVEFGDGWLILQL